MGGWGGVGLGGGSGGGVRVGGDHEEFKFFVKIQKKMGGLGRGGGAGAEGVRLGVGLVGGSGGM